VGSYVLYSSTQGAGDLQPNRASNLIRILVWSLAGIVVVLAIAFAVTAITLPGCTLCHRGTEFVDQTKASAHADVTCVRCHVERGASPRVAYAYHMIFGMALRIAPTGSGPVAGIADQTCLSCHSAVMTRVVTVNGLSIKHAKCANGRMCVNCHSDTAHGRAVKWIQTSQMNQCLDCHAAPQVRSNCTTCHANKSSEERIRSGEWVVTHGPTWRQTHGMGDLKTCAACHPDDFCVRCHGIPLPHEPSFLRTHPLSVPTHREDCAVCHRQTFCDGCHGLEMPHPNAFTKTHSALVKKQGNTLCLRCHIEDDCTNCHVRHVHPGGAIAPAGSGSK
jgi:hypothetical protein